MAIPFLKGIDVSGTVDLSNLTIDGAQGTDGQVLTSTGSGIAWEDASGTSLSGGAANKLAIWNSATALTNDTQLHWDASNDRLGIGTANPTTDLHVSGSALFTSNATVRGNLIIDKNPSNYPSAKLQFLRNGSTSPAMGEIIMNDNPGHSGMYMYARRIMSPYVTSYIELPTSSSYDFEINLLGTNAVTIDSSTRNLGIGTTNPAEKLHVVGSTLIEGSSVELKVEGAGSYDTANITMGNAAKADTFEISVRQDPGANYATLDYDGYSPTGTSQIRLGGNYLDFNTAGSSRMRIISSGNVGIGTLSPLTNLHVSSGTSGDATVIIEADTDNNQENDLPRLWFKADGGITEGAIQLSDNKLDIINNVSTGGGIVFKTGTTNNYNTTDPDNGAAQRMIITSGGNVGIGADSPDRSLVLNHASDTRVKLQVNGTDTAQIQTLANQARYHALGSSTSLQLWTNGAEGMRIDNSGNVGINETSPDEKLHVDGAARITNRIYNTQHTSGNLSSGQWYRIVEITGSSGRGKCEFSIGGSGGSGTPSLVKATVNTAWSNTNSTIKVDFNSKSSAFSEFRVVRNATSNKSFVDVKLGVAEDVVLVQVYPIAWESAYAVDFTNVTTLPSGDSVETSVPLTNTAFALANNNGSDVDPVFKVDHNSKVHAEEFIGQRVIVNGNAYHSTANSVFQLYSTSVGMTTSTSSSMHYPYSAIIMPFNGVVEKVIIKNVKYSSYQSGPSASGTARIQLKQYDSTYAPMDYSSGNVSFTAAANVSMTFTPNQSYSEGTHFRVFWNSSAVWRYVTFQIVLKQTS